MQESSQGGDLFPVDDATYNLLQSLVSKLEALDTYQTYMEDATDQEDQTLFQELIEEDRQHAQKLLDVVKRRLAQS